MKQETLMQMRERIEERITNPSNPTDKRLAEREKKAISFIEILLDKGIPLEDITTNDWNSSTNPSIYVATGPQRGTWSGRKISLNQGLPNVDKFVKMVQLKARVEKLEAFTEKYISYEFPHPKTRTSSHGPEVKRSLVNQQRDSFLTNLDKLGIHYQWDKKSYKVTLPSRDRKKADEAYKLIEQWYK